MLDDDIFSIIDDSDQSSPATGSNGSSNLVWNILVVDDEKVVHEATRLAISYETIFGRKVELHHAYSSIEAMEKIRSGTQFAVALIDVVMEQADSGLKLVENIRKEGLHELRIVLRTGQPGYAPEISVLTSFDINDYRTKNELTKNKLLSVLLTSIRSYMQIRSIDKARSGLELIVEASSDLFQRKNVKIFASGVLTQMSAILGYEISGIVALCPQPDPKNSIFNHANILCSTGKYDKNNAEFLSETDKDKITRVFTEARKKKIAIKDNHSVGIYIASEHGANAFIFIDSSNDLSQEDLALLKIFVSNLSAIYSNINLIRTLDRIAFNNAEVGIPNMNAMRKTISDRIKSNDNSLAIIIIHPENLAKFNSLFGIKAIKEIFIQTNRILTEKFDNAHMIALSSWGDFIVLLEKEKYSSADFKSLTSYTITLNDSRLQMNATVASAHSLPEDDTAENIIQRANLTLLLAKEHHRCKITEYNPDIIRDQKRRIAIHYHLCETFKSSNPTIEVHLQAKYDSINNKIVGAEALSRLQMNGQMVSPVVFIPLLEESGFSDNLLKLLLHEVSKWQKSRRTRGANIFPVSINLTMKDIPQEGYGEKLLHMLALESLSPDEVEFEVTEGAMMYDLKQTIIELEKIKRSGFRIALDDFGTGYSSLSYLNHLPVDTLKIDKMFVDNLTPANAKSSIAATIIAMATSLKLNIVAEGIETVEQTHALQLIGCTIFQGFLYSKPTRIDLFDEQAISASK